MRRIAAVAAALTLSLAASAQAQPPIFGFNDSSYGESPSISQDTVRGMMSDAGATVQRITISWRAIAPSRTTTPASLARRTSAA